MSSTTFSVTADERVVSFLLQLCFLCKCVCGITGKVSYGVISLVIHCDPSELESRVSVCLYLVFSGICVCVWSGGVNDRKNKLKEITFIVG